MTRDRLGERRGRPRSGGGQKPQPELDRLSNILKTFNDQFGTLFSDTDRIVKRVHGDVAPRPRPTSPTRTRRRTPSAARIELNTALMRIVGPLLKDDTEFDKQFVQNASFRQFVTETVEKLNEAREP